MRITIKELEKLVAILNDKLVNRTRGDLPGFQFVREYIQSQSASRLVALKERYARLILGEIKALYTDAGWTFDFGYDFGGQSYKASGEDFVKDYLMFKLGAVDFQSYGFKELAAAFESALVYDGETVSIAIPTLYATFEYDEQPVYTDDKPGKYAL